jgi:hypothetical protein
MTHQVNNIMPSGIQAVFNLAAILGGFGFIVYALFMEPSYAGEHHNIAIMGILLMLLGGQK